MIVPMIKYAFVLHHNDLDNFLTELQKLGVVDVERYDAQLDNKANALFQSSERYTSAYKQLKLTRLDKNEQLTPYPDSAGQMLLAFEGLIAEREQLSNKAKRLEKDIQDALPWGDFEVGILEKFENLGLIPRFYSDFEKSYIKEREEEHAIEVINRANGRVYYVLLQHKGETLNFEQQEMKFPSLSHPVLMKDLDAVQQRLSEINQTLKQMSLSKAILLTEKGAITTAFDFRVAVLNAERKAEGSVAIVNGWIPEPQNNDLVKFLEEQGTLYLSEKAKKDENPPILLKNNCFSKLYEVITRIYSLPNYTELDLTPFMAPFFMLFFGMCFGDGGYGLLVFALCSFLKLKIKGSVRSILSLGQWFGIATIIVCLFTGSFFGMTIGKFNIMGSGGLVEQRFGFNENYAMIFLSIAIGVIQVLFAMCLNIAKIIKQQGFKYALSKIAWIVILLSWMVYLLTNKYLGIGIYAIYVIAGIAVLVAFFYNSPGKNIFLNFGLGIWDTYNMASGLLGDLLSYIRLFALGFTGGVLGMVFNTLAFSIDVGFLPLNILATGLILIMGHALNIALNGLGAVVHPLRLTFVEFYKNSGFEGGGKNYKPFKIN
jgi:V/A-type H+-transporting ATPase subunit I